MSPARRRRSGVRRVISSRKASPKAENPAARRADAPKGFRQIIRQIIRQIVRQIVRQAGKRGIVRQGRANRRGEAGRRSGAQRRDEADRRSGAQRAEAQRAGAQRRRDSRRGHSASKKRAPESESRIRGQSGPKGGKVNNLNLLREETFLPGCWLWAADVGPRSEVRGRRLSAVGSRQSVGLTVPGSSSSSAACRRRPG